MSDLKDNMLITGVIRDHTALELVISPLGNIENEDDIDARSKD